MVALLLDYGADIDMTWKHGTALHAAVRVGAWDLLQLLIKRGGDVNARAENGQTPLHVAAMESRPAMVRSLLKAGADPALKDSFEKTPAGWAADSSLRSVLLRSEHSRRPTPRRWPEAGPDEF